MISIVTDKDKALERRNKAIAEGVFMSREGIFDFYLSEGKDEEEAARLTDIQCKYRPNIDKEPKVEESTTNKLISTFKEVTVIAKDNPEVTDMLIGALQAIGTGILGFAAGMIKSEHPVYTQQNYNQPINTQSMQITQPDLSNIEQPLSLDEIIAQENKENKENKE